MLYHVVFVFCEEVFSLLYYVAVLYYLLYYFLYILYHYIPRPSKYPQNWYIAPYVLYLYLFFYRYLENVGIQHIYIYI